MNKEAQFWEWLLGRGPFPYFKDWPQVPLPVGFSPGQVESVSSPSSSSAPFFCETCNAEKDWEEVYHKDRSTAEADGWEVTCKQCGELLSED